MRHRKIRRVNREELAETMAQDTQNTVTRSMLSGPGHGNSPLQLIDDEREEAVEEIDGGYN